MESLAERLQAGHITRDEALRALTQELKEVVSGFEKRTTQLDEHRGQYRQLSEAVSRALHDLRVEKTDRAALAALLSELAMRLRHDLALPVSE
jgi:hypothetical protein